MGRAPCCEKIGLKKGPWTSQEDQILVSYINQNGHANWRALPKEAGLLRCGKSCRLRWLNYLRPGIKRGNFSKEEEETIIRLHERLGNRWSTIASKLPGRTDNEIKNVWHTYLKKKTENCEKLVPQYNSSSSSEFSSVRDLATLHIKMETKDEQNESFTTLNRMDTIFKLDNLAGNSDTRTDFFDLEDFHFQNNEYNMKNDNDSMDFWYKVLIRTGGLPKFPEFGQN